MYSENEAAPISTLATSPVPIMAEPGAASQGATVGSHRSAWRSRALPLLIVIVGVITYFNSFEGAFLFDDHLYISENQTIRQLWPAWPAMFAPKEVSRPLIGLSLAINYAISGLRPWSYHAMNLLVHLLAALALYGIVRRTLLTERLRQRFGSQSESLALAVALIWMVHPLLTASVTYVIQRCESMMGLFYLATLYLSIRGFSSARPRRWYVAAVFACAAGMLCKQVMVTAPIAVLVYDFLFVSSSLREALRRRWRFYAGLAAAWGVLAVVLIASPTNSTAGFAVKDITPLHYFVSEFRVILLYLRLSVWPSGLILDYDWAAARTLWEVLPYGLAVAGLFAAMAWGLIRKRELSFAGVWFFLILSLTSSFMPFSDLVFEHRMYLPLAGVVSFLVIGGYAAGKRLIDGVPGLARVGRLLSFAAPATIIALLAFATMQQNVYYSNDLAMWANNVKLRPDCARAHSNLAKALFDRGRLEEAQVEVQRACDLRSDDYRYQSNLGFTLCILGQTEEGLAHLRRSIELKPSYYLSHASLGKILAGRGQTAEAMAEFSFARLINPEAADVHYSLGLLLQKQGRLADALAECQTAARLDPQTNDYQEQVQSLMAEISAGQKAENAGVRNPVP